MIDIKMIFTEGQMTSAFRDGTYGINDLPATRTHTAFLTSASPAYQASSYCTAFLFEIILMSLILPAAAGRGQTLCVALSAQDEGGAEDAQQQAAPHDSRWKDVVREASRVEFGRTARAGGPGLEPTGPVGSGLPCRC